MRKLYNVCNNVGLQKQRTMTQSNIMYSGNNVTKNSQTIITAPRKKEGRGDLYMSPLAEDVIEKEDRRVSPQA